MLGINKVYLVGHLGADPKMQVSKNGKSFAKISLATNRSRKQEDGSFQDITDWHNVTVWGKQGDACSGHLKKGSKVMVEGYLSHYKTESEEGKESTWHTGITAHSIEFFNAKQEKVAA